MTFPTTLFLSGAVFLVGAAATAVAFHHRITRSRSISPIQVACYIVSIAWLLLSPIWGLAICWAWWASGARPSSETQAVWHFRSLFRRDDFNRSATRDKSNRASARR